MQIGTGVFGGQQHAFLGFGRRGMFCFFGVPFVLGTRDEFLKYFQRDDLVASVPGGRTFQGEIEETFSHNAKVTEAQREALGRKVVGDLVEWTFEISDVAADFLKMRVLSSASPEIECVLLFPAGEERALIERLRIGEEVTCRGHIASAVRGKLTINPAILVPSGEVEKKAMRDALADQISAIIKGDQ